MVVLAALYMWVEEWIWDRTAALMARIARAPFMQSLERRLAALPPWGALIVFLLPGTLLLPVKIGALFLAGRGHYVAGVSVIVAAKVLGTAIVARLFAVCRPALLTVHWFRVLHDWVLRFKESLYARVRAHPAWQAAVRLKEDTKTHWKHYTRNWRPGMITRRWRAIGYRMKKRALRRLRR